MEALEKVGRVSKAFGREGELIVNLYDIFPVDFDMEEPLFAKIDSLAVPLFLEEFEPRGRSGALVRFADFDTDARAAELIGCDLYLRTATDEEDDDEIYMEDLVGFAVTFVGRDLQGEITDYVDSELNPLFEVTVGDREVYVPAVEEMIVALDIERREVEFSLPEGLLELYL